MLLVKVMLIPIVLVKEKVVGNQLHHKDYKNVKIIFLYRFDKVPEAEILG